MQGAGAAAGIRLLIRYGRHESTASNPCVAAPAASSVSRFSAWTAKGSFWWGVRLSIPTTSKPPAWRSFAASVPTLPRPRTAILRSGMVGPSDLELDALREWERTGVVDGVGLPAHVGSPGVRPGLASASGVF